MAMPDTGDLSFVYFGNDWFAENRTSSHHISRRLGTRYPLLYVEVPGLRAPKATARDVRKLLQKLRNALRPPRQIGPHFWHMTLPQVPFRRHGAVRAVNQTFATWAVRRALRKLRFVRPVSWFVVPHPGFLAGQLGERLAVYYCIDDYSALPDVDVSEVRKMDEELARRVDLLFAASPGLVAAKRAQNPNVVFSPHGVDADLFRQAADRTRPVAEAVQRVRHPVIGFFGLLDGRFDFELIRFLARSRPDWTFLLVGRVSEGSGSFKGLENVITPGMVPYETLPQWARAFDVCIMPYFQDAFSAAANPLKLREYLATGKPVISVPMPEVDRFADLVYVARSHDEFLRHIETALASDSEELHGRRMAAVAGSTWDARVEEVVRTVLDHLGRSAAGRHAAPGA